MLQAFWYGIGRFLVALAARIVLRMDVLWKAARPQGPVILAANHPSTTDPFLATTLIPEQATILIKGFIFKLPVVGWSLRRCGHIPVVAGNGKNALEEAEKLLKAGRSIIIFPEGEISPEGGFHKAKTGLARLALSTGAPVIPVGISIETDYLRLIESKAKDETDTGTWYFYGPYTVTLGEAVCYEGDVEDRDRVRVVSEEVMGKIISLTHESALRRLEKYPRLSLPLRVFRFGLRVVLAD